MLKGTWMGLAGWGWLVGVDAGALESGPMKGSNRDLVKVDLGSGVGFGVDFGVVTGRFSEGSGVDSGDSRKWGPGGPGLDPQAAPHVPNCGSGSEAQPISRGLVSGPSNWGLGWGWGLRWEVRWGLGVGWEMSGRVDAVGGGLC